MNIRRDPSARTPDLDRYFGDYVPDHDAWVERRRDDATMRSTRHGGRVWMAVAAPEPFSGRWTARLLRHRPDLPPRRTKPQWDVIIDRACDTREQALEVLDGFDCIVPSSASRAGLTTTAVLP